MERKGTALVFDFGASSGRAMLCQMENGRIHLEELHRFENCPVEQNGLLCWDLEALFHEIKTGLLRAKEAGGFSCVGVDTWGVDFGLLDASGKLLGLPVHYRDGRTAGLSQTLAEQLGGQELFAQSGLPCMGINTLVQLLALKRDHPDLLAQADTLLLMPDLFTWFLSGERRAERTIASTTQMLDARTGGWNLPLLQRLELPTHLLPSLLEPGRIAGTLAPALCAELGLEPVPVAAVASHDTESALLAVPARGNHFAFLSCGTWSLFGTELDAPNLTPEAQACGLANESAVGGKTAFLKNIIGLWLIQETRRQFGREGREYSFAQMEALAQESKPFLCLIDPDAPVLTPPGDIPGRIRQLCAENGQPVPQTDGAVIRCIYESLAMKFRFTLLELQACTGYTYPSIYVVGGGAKDRFLCQMTADASGVPVVAGPVEATALGNAAAQFMALGLVKNAEEAREMIRTSFTPETFIPSHTQCWAELDQRYQSL